MTDPFVAEIRIFGFNFAPTGWAQCDGQLLPISQNTGLFSICGTFYGGDGKATFALPNLQGSAPMGVGQGSGLSDRVIGEAGGSATVALLNTQMPLHAHSMSASQADAGSRTPEGEMLATGIAIGQYAPPSAPAVSLSPQALSPTGDSQPHNNMQPYLAANFCIALQGVFPPHS